MRYFLPPLAILLPLLSHAAEGLPHLGFAGRAGQGCTAYSTVVKTPPRAPIEVDMYLTCQFDQEVKETIVHIPPHFSRVETFLVDCTSKDSALAKTRYFRKQFWRDQMTWDESKHADPFFIPYKNSSYEAEFDQICATGIAGSGAAVPLGYTSKKK
ncbi:hypothetical protein [Janthinobacterium sp. 17J80-10]|uniref:hypothetical protein n=1 Tax=Janthinobacterium sp. 17J80-10 TaxID=2497863 RepID=UPI001005341C|nr:hypothetical protein [Janthinobacterium sp. 17J80-10]QAU33119.1 hypothetical protein EKL02_02405 [Janthinobacterium sp. 17J80-10]